MYNWTTQRGGNDPTESELFVRHSSCLLLLALALLIPGCGGGSDDDFYNGDVPYDSTYYPPSQPLPPQVGQPPQLRAYYDSYDTVANTILVVDDFYGVLSNDVYTSGDAYIEFPSSSVQGGDIDGYTDGSFDYEPPTGFTGNDSFRYTLYDNSGQSSSAEVFLRVNSQ